MRSAREGLEVSGVVRHGTTAILTDVVDDRDHRLLEDAPSSALLAPVDIENVAHLFEAAETLSLQIQQSADVLLAVAHLAEPQVPGSFSTARSAPATTNSWR